MNNNIEKRYRNKSYLSHNPTWDQEHAPWKAKQIIKLLNSNNIIPESICDIGCGSGSVLVELKKKYPSAQLYGYDISPDLHKFWDKYSDSGIQFKIGNIPDTEDKHNILLMLDVLEHLSNPFDFLQQLKGHAEYYIFHIPLDLSAFSVIRESPLLYVREKVGHIHYYTKSIALALLAEAGYETIYYRYTNAYRTAPGSNINTKLMIIPRMIFQIINKDIGVRIFGGETLIVLAKQR